MTTGCGDGSEIYPLLISNTQGRYGLEQSLPPVAYFKEAGMSGGKYGNECAEVVSKATKNGWEPTSLFSEKDVLNLADNSTTTLLSATTDDFIDWRDLDKDGIPELVIAVMKWDSTECHFCSHYWWVGVYKYQNGEFNVDNNFNSGLLLSTENKYDLYDIQGWIPIPNNIFGIVSGYFGLGYIESNKLINFNFGSRTESKIWKEVNLHYHISQ